MTRPPRRPVLFLFADGVGLARKGPENPFATLPLPALDELVGGLWRRDLSGGRADLHALDANLGVDGLPQSATGQTTLFTGVNAAEHIGHHVPALPGGRLRRLLAERSVFRRLATSGASVTFANVFTQEYLDRMDAGEARASATTLAVRAAGVRFRLPEDYARRRAVAWDVTGERFRARSGVTLPEVSARQAGRNLAGLAADHDCTLFETFLPDLAGHRRWGIGVHEALEALDGLLEGILETLAADATVLLTSDHGNVEEPQHRRHTRNPVPLVVWGAGREAFAGAVSIAEVAGRVESWWTGGGGS